MGATWARHATCESALRRPSPQRWIAAVDYFSFGKPVTYVATSLNHSVAALNIVEFLSAYNKAINYVTDGWGALWQNQNLGGLTRIDLTIASPSLHLYLSFRKLVRDCVLSVHFTDEARYLTDILNHASNATLSIVKITHLPVSCFAVESCKWRER